MNTIIDYLKWRGDLPLAVVPFNEVDAGILARFSYEPFDNMVSSNFREQRRVKDVCDDLINSPSLHDDVLNSNRDFDFIRLVGASKRFGDMLISGYVNDIDEERQIQFSACVFDIDEEQNYYVAFRGTDNTIIGWKEDFNMGFEFPVPAQKKALAYFESVATAFKDGTFIIGGHSKGGNLSVYAATFCDDKFNSPVTDIYNFDGPGFTEDIMQTDKFRKIEHHIHTYVPQFSVVGMILEHLEDYCVVHSDESGIMQHEILSWETDFDKFVHLEEVSAGSRFVDKTFKEWISGLDKTQREQFVDTVFNLMMSGDTHTLAEFSKNKAENLNAMIKTYNEIDDEMKKGFLASAKRLFGSAGIVLKSAADKTKD
ncbi:MAG: DUF2974 domain-containing protein [Clostridiales bacterium]|nr:DUF2974 domain-containing protein [Clostridiales bacterium]